MSQITAQVNSSSIGAKFPNLPSQSPNNQLISNLSPQLISNEASQLSNNSLAIVPFQPHQLRNIQFDSTLTLTRTDALYNDKLDEIFNYTQ